MTTDLDREDEVERLSKAGRTRRDRYLNHSYWALVIAYAITQSLHWVLGYSFENWYPWFLAAAIGLPVLGMLNQLGRFNSYSITNSQIRVINNRITAIETNLSCPDNERGQKPTVKDSTIENWRRRAEAGNVDSQFSFGLHHSVAGREAEAARWYRKSAEQGHAYAQHYLGIAYANSAGVSHDDSEAYFWLSLSATSWDKAAKDRDLLAHRLTAAKRAEIDESCRKWLETHPQGMGMVSMQAIEPRCPLTPEANA